MLKFKNLISLLEPTTASFSFSLILSLLVVAAGLWFSDIRSGVLFNTLTFGSNAPAITITSSQTSLAQFNDRVFGNPLLNKILFYCAWLLVGCLVYIAVTAIIAFGSESVEAVEELNYVHAQRGRMERFFLSRLAVRLLAIGLEVVYFLTFIKLILPYSVYAAHVGINQAHLGSGLLYIAASIVVLLISWHIHVVLLRLAALRTRLFDSD